MIFPRNSCTVPKGQIYLQNPFLKTSTVIKFSERDLILNHYMHPR